MENEMYVKVIEREIDNNLRFALKKAKWEPSKAYKVLAYSGDKVFVHINNKVVDIFSSKVETMTIGLGI